MDAGGQTGLEAWGRRWIGIGARPNMATEAQVASVREVKKGMQGVCSGDGGRDNGEVNVFVRWQRGARKRLVLSSYG